MGAPIRHPLSGLLMPTAATWRIATVGWRGALGVAVAGLRVAHGSRRALAIEHPVA